MMRGRELVHQSEGYDVALVCLNGHLINEYARRHPEDNKKHCSDCGAATTDTCSKCETSIQGRYFPGALTIQSMPVPSFCHECGAPYPWTESRLEAVREMTDETELDEKDKAILIGSLGDIARETPKTELWAEKVRKVFRRAEEISPKALRQLFVDISSETAKKILLDGRPI